MVRRRLPELVKILAVGYVASISLFLYSIILNHSFGNAYLILNIFLATIPLLLSWRLIKVLLKKRWSSWEALALTFVWIIFLPNSFYMISDYIHLQSMPSRTILYNTVMFSSFIYMAMFMGIISLYLVHLELKKRINPRAAATLIAIVLVGCCFAIYLGRDLRWNSWDVIINPGGLLFDISNLILRPETYPDMGRTMVGFFIFLSSIYYIAWKTARIVWHKGVNDMVVHIRKRQDG